MEVVPVEIQKRVSETELMVKTYDNFIVASADERIVAAEHIKKIKIRFKELEDLRKSLTQPLDESKSRIMDIFRKPLEFLKNAETNVKSAVLNWEKEQELIRQEQERKLQETARKEEERLRKIKEEQERIWREKEEAKRKEAEQLASEGKAEEAEKARLEAEKAAAKAAERAMQAEEISIPVPIVASKVEKIKGIATKTIWKFRIVDVNKIPRKYMIPNEKLLGEIARATKDLVKIEGVEFYSEDIMSSRT